MITLMDGKIVPNNKLTIPLPFPPIYAYCSDTIYLPRIIEQIYGVDLLFHEATLHKGTSPCERNLSHNCFTSWRNRRTAKVKQLLIGHFQATTKMKAYCYRKHRIFFLTLYLHGNIKISIESIKP